MKSFPKNSCYASFKALFAQPVTYGVRISHHVLLLASIVWVLLQGAQISSIGCLQFSKDVPKTEQNFFVAYGLHKVHCYILIIPVLFLMILFFCYGSFFQPHQPWDCPAEFYDLYPEEVVGLPANPYVPEVIG